MAARASHHNRILEKAYRRADALEDKLAAVVEAVLLEAADVAARNFVRLAVDHGAMTAAGPRRDPPTAAGIAETLAWQAAHPGEVSPPSPYFAAMVAAAGQEVGRKAMVALKPRPAEAAAIAQAEGEPAWTLHQTLAFLGEVDGPLEQVLEALRPVAAEHPALQGAVGGAGAFQVGDGPHPQILLPDVPGMVELRVAVTEALHRAGVPYSREHGFAPHVTVGYQDAPVAPPEPPYGLPLHFDGLWVVRGDEEAYELPLLGQAPAMTAAAAPGEGFCLPAGLRTKTDPVRLAVVETVAQAAVEGAGLAFDVTNPLISGSLTETASQITHISQTTQLDVMKTIRASYEEGLSIPDTAKAIQAVMREAAPERARLIARTELAGAVNGASLAATRVVQEETGAAYLKVWMTAPGAHFPRHELVEGLDGQERPLEQPFDVEGADLMYPGDPSGPAEEVCNCRCTVSYVDRAGNDAEGDGGDADLTAGGSLERDLARAFRRPLILEQVAQLQALTAAAGPAGWSAPAASEVLDVSCEAPRATARPVEEHARGATVPSPSAAIPRFWVEETDRGLERGWTVFDRETGLRAHDFLGRPLNGLSEDEARATAARMTAAEQQAPTAGARPWAHLKDSTLKSHISHAKTDLSRTTDAGERARLTSKLEGLQRELGIREGTVEEPRPWKHLKDSTLKSHVSHAKGDLRRATDPEERARLEAKLADLNREVELRGGTVVRETVEKKPPPPPEPRPWQHLKGTTLKSHISHAKGDLRKAVDGAEKDRLRLKLTQLERELELRQGGAEARDEKIRAQRERHDARRDARRTPPADPARPTPYTTLQYQGLKGELEEGVLYRTEAGHRTYDQGGGYTAKAGYTAKVGETLLFVEDGGALPASTAVEAFRRQFGGVKSQMSPAQAAKLRGVDLFKGRCSADSWFAERYNRPGFRAAATAGSGEIHYWGESSRNLVDPAGHNILAHEMGHIVGVDNGPPSVSAWKDAQSLDKAWNAPGAGDLWKVEDGVSTYENGDLYSSSAPRFGRETVSDYAATTIKEEWAESVRLYLENALHDPGAMRFGTVRDAKTGFMRPATFKDVYPNRAKILEKQLQGKTAGGDGRARPRAQEATATPTLASIGVEPGQEFVAERERRFADDVARKAEAAGVTPEQAAAKVQKTVEDVTRTSELRMRTPLEVVDQILSDGRFKSQFETGTSMGELGGQRAAAEQTLFGYPKGLPAEERPVYGYLSNSEGWRVDLYGDAAWTFKPELRARTTFTATDSLTKDAVPSPVDSPSKTSVSFNFVTGGLDEPGKWGQYWETQMHGGVTLDDVQAVDLYNTQYQDAGQLSALQGRLEERGIEVRLHQGSE